MQILHVSRKLLFTFLKSRTAESGSLQVRKPRALFWTRLNSETALLSGETAQNILRAEVAVNESIARAPGLAPARNRAGFALERDRLAQEDI